MLYLNRILACHLLQEPDNLVNLYREAEQCGNDFEILYKCSVSDGSHAARVDEDELTFLRRNVQPVFLRIGSVRYKSILVSDIVSARFLILRNSMPADTT